MISEIFIEVHKFQKNSCIDLVKHIKKPLPGILELFLAFTRKIQNKGRYNKNIYKYILFETNWVNPSPCGQNAQLIS